MRALLGFGLFLLLLTVIDQVAHARTRAANAPLASVAPLDQPRELAAPAVNSRRPIEEIGSATWPCWFFRPPLAKRSVPWTLTFGQCLPSAAERPMQCWLLLGLSPAAVDLGSSGVLRVAPLLVLPAVANQVVRADVPIDGLPEGTTIYVQAVGLVSDAPIHTEVGLQRLALSNAWRVVVP